MNRPGLVFLGTVTLALTASAQVTPWTIDAGLTFSHFQQQVKAEVGNPRGERLVNELQFGVMALGTFNVWKYLDAGVFVQFDRGNRHAARFDGFDPMSGKTVTTGKIGGNFSEWWAGPMVRLQWKEVFGEFGYGLFGFRNDDARTDIKSSTGDSTGALQFNPSIAWYASLGGAVGITEDVDLVFRMEFRLRYYEKRDGNPFQDGLEHGTQNITPFFGVRWRF